ncbi:ABC transporter permease [Vibrio sonorensis]|uniref:ABC transporter permease n=1 Tax=Vibrio sonorensis TaxID=1004316 RepID=UPI0008D998E2|nr:thiamine ABC transporter permease [Vibrio sonorensis]
MFRALYLFVLLICIAPILPGLIGVVSSSFGYIPPIGLNEITLHAYIAIFDWAGVERSLLLTISSALISTYLACIICFAILQQLWLNKHWRKIESSLSPLLAMPHVAFAIGFAFLFAPTGLVARWADQVFGFSVSGDSLPWLVNDPYGIGLTLALALKEVPFLLLMSIPVLHQIQVEKRQKISSSLGYSPAQTWWKAIFPQWFKRMRFALFAVIAYGAAVVDLSLILGPTNPPTFSVLVWQWFNDPELNQIPRAAAGGIVLLVITSLLMACVVWIEKTLTNPRRHWLISGRCGTALPGKSLFTVSALLAIFIFPLMVIWSFAHRWRFPDLFPSRLSLRFWHYEWQNILPVVNQTLFIAVTVAVISLLLALLAHEYRVKHRLSIPDYVIALPMLVPQLSLLFGMQISTLYIQGDFFTTWVIWSHVFFAFPFVYLALDGPWRSYNINYTRAALSLGKTPFNTFVTVKLRLLLPAVMYAWAIGASVSLAQYLPTLMLGAGRISTITTEAVALASGSDRRVTAIYGLWQAVLPFIFFSAAMVISRMYHPFHRSRKKETKTHDTLSRKPRHL